MRRLAAPLLAAVLVLSACGDDEIAGPGSAGSASPSATGTSGKPVVDRPTGNPPTKLEITDITEGTGPAAKPGDIVHAHYVGVAWSTAKEFDSSWDRGQPFPFQLGAGNVIKGWDQGLVGMKVGGRRKLVIPPDLGYADRGSGPDIKPGETLIFVVDLVKIGQ